MLELDVCETPSEASNSTPPVKTRIFVLDTNILMHDPNALFRFAEHDIFLPMVVLEELDSNKRGVSEVARNVRQTNRTLVSMMAGYNQSQITQGIRIKTHPDDSIPRGRLFFQTSDTDTKLPSTLPGAKADNNILASAIALQEERPAQRVTIVSKDINLRIKASILGISAEDYFTDKVLEDVEDLHQGVHELSDNFWDQVTTLDSGQENAQTYYTIDGKICREWQPNDFIYLPSDDKFAAMVSNIHENRATLRIVTDYRHPKNNVWGLVARNIEQSFALNALMDPTIDFVSLQGAAGSGKTLLALAAGLAQCMDAQLYREIIMTRVTVPVGEDIGYLPGNEEEKMTPWMGAVLDNLEVLTSSEEHGEWEREATQDILQYKIKIRSLNFMRGRTFLNRYVVIDEAQNLTSKQIKTLITRAGPGTKLVCLGDTGQIDTPYLSATTSGLTYAIDRFKSWRHSAHVMLKRGERSRLAEFGAENL